MSRFKYQATNPQNRKISGLVEARNENEATEILKDKNYEIISIEEKRSNFGGGINNFFTKIAAKDLVVFSRQFAVLISANVALVQSLKLLVEQTSNEKMKMAISEIADEVDGGTKLSDSLGQRSHIFSNFFVNVVRSGESSGKLDEVLNYLADELEKDYDMTSKIKGAMIYPAFVFCGLGGVGAVMMIFVVPKLTAMMAETGGVLPLPTRILMGFSDAMVNYWYVFLALLIGSVLGYKQLVRLPAGRKIVDTLLLRAPIFGKLFQRIYLVRFTRSFQTLIVGGVAIGKALDITSEVVSNAVYKELISETKKEVEDGNSISSVFVHSDQVPSMVSQMLKIGEKTGRLDMVLERITDFYTREVNNIIANLMTLMEPIIMVTMGVGVGIMVAAIIMPMYQMATNM
ncbi:MAG: type II secretion system F family protein [Candidatus Falkowbacteria bacterium]